MKTFFASRTPILDRNGKVTGYKMRTYRREKPKVNHQAEKAARRRSVHASFTVLGIPRRLNGQKLGFRKRMDIFNQREAEMLATGKGESV